MRDIVFETLSAAASYSCAIHHVVLSFDSFVMLGCDTIFSILCSLVPYCQTYYV